MNKLMIQMEGIVKRFGSITALDNMNFHAYGGEITAIVGDNGSGKKHADSDPHRMPEAGSGCHPD